VFWQIISGLRGKKIDIATSIKDQNDVLLSNEEDIICRWMEYFEDLRNPDTITPLTTGGAFGGGKYHHCRRGLH